MSGECLVVVSDSRQRGISVPNAKPRLGCLGPQRPGCFAGRQPMTCSMLHILFVHVHIAAMVLAPPLCSRWRSPRAVMPRQGQRPNGLLASGAGGLTGASTR